jgi:hypothetical protein
MCLFHIYMYIYVYAAFYVHIDTYIYVHLYLKTGSLKHDHVEKIAVEKIDIENTPFVLDKGKKCPMGHI